MVFMNYAMQIVMSFMRMTMRRHGAPGGCIRQPHPGSHRNRAGIEDGKLEEAPESTGHRVKNVCFRYPTGPIMLKDISFQAARGETIALSGRQAAVKHPAHLIPRFYEATEGRF